VGLKIDFQLFGAPPQGEILFLEIPQTALVSYTGGLLLQEVNSGGTFLQTGYQSGVKSNPFTELTANGTTLVLHCSLPVCWVYWAPH
jgi:hypothetical protein